MTHLDDLLREIRQLSNMNSETLIANSLHNLIQERNLLPRNRIRLRLDMRHDMIVLDVRDLLDESRQFVEMSCEETVGSNLGRDVSK